MNNLLQNSNWQQTSPEGGPLHYSGSGPATFDKFALRGNRTCSVTQASGSASDMYTLPIPVKGRRAIAFGYIIRAVEANSIVLAADFTDASGNIIKSERVPIQSRVTFKFSCVSTRFTVPANAENVKLSMLFEGKVTACTFCAPYAAYQ